MSPTIAACFEQDDDDLDDDLEDFIVNDEDEEGEEGEEDGEEGEDEEAVHLPGHHRDRSVLHKYRRLLEEKDTDSAGPSAEGTGEDEEGEEGDEEDEDEEGEEGDEEDEEGEEGDEEDEVEGAGAEGVSGPPSRQLWCSLCGRSRHPDDFSDRQRRNSTDQFRFCLHHTGEHLG